MRKQTIMFSVLIVLGVAVILILTQQPAARFSGGQISERGSTKGSIGRAAPITVIVQRHNISITVNGKTYPTQRLW